MVASLSVHAEIALKRGNDADPYAGPASWPRIAPSGLSAVWTLK